MLILPGYQTQHKVEETGRSLIYTARRESDGRAVILKCLKEEYPSADSVARFKREFQVARQLNEAEGVSDYDLVVQDNRPVIVIRDFGGVSLKSYLQEQQLSLTDFMRLAIELSYALEQIHRQNVIHKDINPSNIIFNPATHQVKIIDFGIATILSRETPTFRNPTVLEGTLAYMSPEQTGRMNRAMDYRTDYYSLGVTLYELLTGRLPFASNDVMALVHAHIARQPTPPHQLDPAIPQALSEIVLKLLAKNARDRYQSAHGLRADLEHCLEQWQAAGQIEPFPLGAHDFSDRFRIPQTLYGREAEIQTLLAALDRASQGASEMMLVTGLAGIGKTALVQETYRPLTGQRGYFIAGKFDQLQRNIPYSSFIQAFRALIHQILTESNVKIELWRQKLLAALGVNGRVIMDVLPEMGLIIGAQPVAPALAPAAAQNRFMLLFQKLVQVFAGPSHPLVIFLDDLQWADAASLKLIQELLTAADSQHLFLIGAYRHNEVGSGHPLRLTLREISQSGATMHELSLGPLKLPSIDHFIADALHSAPEAVRPLAELVQAKTDGNPFFMNEFLKSLYAEGLLAFDYQQRRWQWSLADIQARQLADNVVELMAGKVQQLQPETQSILRLAACIGNQFDLQTLAIVAEKGASAAAADLWPAVASGLVMPLGDAYKWVEWQSDSLSKQTPVIYRFAHDRIQQAVYSLIDARDRQAVHFQVGRLLLQETPPERQEQRLFDIINHLNLCRDLMTTQAERDELAALNYIAGQRAKASAAYASARAYLESGLDCLSPAAWQEQYDLTLKLHTATAEAAYLCADFAGMARLATAVRRQARNPLDQARVYEIEIQAAIAQNRLLDAVHIARQALLLLGEQFPEQPDQADVAQALLEVRLALAGTPVAGLLDRPKMTHPQKRAAMRVMSRVFSAAYLSTPAMFSLIVCRQALLSIQYGNAIESSFAYAAYGLLLCGGVSDVDSGDTGAGYIDAGHQFGRLALNLLAQSQDKERQGRVLEVVHAFVTHWKEHIRVTFDPLLEAYRAALDAGDLGYASYAAFVRVYHLFAAGCDLGEVEGEMALYSDAVSKLKQETVLHLNNLYWQVVLNLRGDTAQPTRLLGPIYDEREMVPRHTAAGDRGSLFHFYFNKLVLSFLFQRYEEAVGHAAVAAEYLDSVTASLPVPIFYFYDSLARLAVYEQLDSDRQAETRRKVADNQGRLEHWAWHAPMNHRHKHYLVAAELARVTGRPGDAREYYDQAINLAREHEYANEEALAYELAGRFYLTKTRLPIAQIYLHEARYTYACWGARAKVQQLDHDYQAYFIPGAAGQSPPRLAPLTPTTSGQQIASALDLMSVVKASQAISSEIELNRLLARLMKIAIENAGAQLGYLALRQAGHLCIVATGTAEQEDGQTLPAIPLEAVAAGQELPSLSPEIIYYVARTQENVVLNDARREGPFVHTPYIVAQEPKSILCAPLLNQGGLLGVIYLENNLATAAFTPERVEVVRLLATQAAISITNAQAIAAHAEQERLQLENEFLERQSRDLARLNADKDKFFSIVSHDLRGPFNALIAGSQLLLLRLDSYSHDEIRQKTQYLYNSSRAAYLLLENLLTWSRLQMGRMVYEPALIAVDELAQNTLNLLRETAANKQITLSHTIPPRTLAAIDKYMIDTVIRNLTSNAIKFTPNGGRVEISATPAPAPDEGFLRVTVRDNGVGMSQAEMAKLFRIDVHFSNPGTQDEKGSGLGLTICKEMVERNGGRIWLESEEGQGTAVSFTLPSQM